MQPLAVVYLLDEGANPGSGVGSVVVGVAFGQTAMLGLMSAQYGTVALCSISGNAGGLIRERTET